MSFNVPCGRQQKDILLLNLMKKYKNYLHFLKNYTYKYAVTHYKNEIGDVINTFQIETAHMFGKPLPVKFIHQLIKKTCKKINLQGYYD